MNNTLNVFILSFVLGGPVFGAGTETSPTSIDSGSPQEPGPIQKKFGGSNQEEKSSVAPSGSGTTQNSNSTIMMSGVKGTVVSIDRSGNRIRIQNGDGKVSEYRVNSATNFKSDLPQTTFLDVKPGDPVTIDFTRESGVISRLDLTPISRQQPPN